MTKDNKGTLGFILVITAMIIALFNPVIGIVCLALILIFAVAESYSGDKPDNNPDNPFL